MGTDNIGRDNWINSWNKILIGRYCSDGYCKYYWCIFGCYGGFFGDRNLRMPRVKYYFTILGIFLGLFYGLECVNTISMLSKTIDGSWELLLSLLLITVIIIGLRFISRFLMFGKLKDEMSVPIDTFVSRGIEILNSIPRLILIITISAIFTRSIWLIVTIIGLTSWTGIARFTRAEFYV